MSFCSRFPVALWLTCLLLLAGCATLEVGIERAPTGGGDVRATAVALATRVTVLETQVAAAPTPSPPATGLRALAYVQGGDIWVLTLPDGTPQRLTTDGRNHTPRWSPSQQWLTYYKDTELWVSRRDGTAAREVTDAGDAAWSPVADRLAYIRDEVALYLIEPVALGNTGEQGAGSELYYEVGDYDPATDTERYTLLSRPVWHPDGDHVAYTVLRLTAMPETLATDYAGLWSSEAVADGASEEHYGIDDPETNLLLVDWLPTGEGLIFWYDPDFAVTLYDGYALLQPAVYRLGDEEPQELDVTMVPQPSFVARSQASNRVVLVVGGNVWTGASQQLYLLENLTSVSWALTDDTTVAISPVFHPDGNRLAYVAAPEDSPLQDRRIWVLRETAAGVQAQQLTSDPAYRDESPRWSADGSLLLLARLDAGGQASLWLMPAEGGTPTQVVERLTPAPDPFGQEGVLDWGRLFDW